MANLRLGRPEKALEDAIKGCGGTNTSEKGLFRRAKALYALGKYDTCLEVFKEMMELYPDNKYVRLELEAVEERLREQKTGVYNFREMYEQAKASPPIIDCATYVGPVAVRDSPGRGRGLFTTRPVKAGELLLCEKAFAYSFADENDPAARRNTRLLMNLSTKKMTMGGQAYLISQIVQKLYHNPESAEPFRDLHHGDYRPVSVAEVDGKHVVDR